MPRPQRRAPAYDEKAVDQLFRRQRGIVSRAQLLSVGATPADIRAWVRGRHVHRLSAGVYGSTRTPDLLQRVWWACLHYGRAAVADESALQLARAADGRHLTS